MPISHQWGKSNTTRSCLYINHGSKGIILLDLAVKFDGILIADDEFHEICMTSSMIQTSNILGVFTKFILSEKSKIGATLEYACLDHCIL